MSNCSATSAIPTSLEWRCPWQRPLFRLRTRPVEKSRGVSFIEVRRFSSTDETGSGRVPMARLLFRQLPTGVRPGRGRRRLDCHPRRRDLRGTQRQGRARPALVSKKPVANVLDRVEQFGISTPRQRYKPVIETLEMNEAERAALGRPPSATSRCDGEPSRLGAVLPAAATPVGKHPRPAFTISIRTK